ncbi:MAG TPA: transketolase C-terminal domain-containing protein [Gemmataceae bacterium]|jgi:transketolase|nr:transketolase C-terminal domain-containing protein [Gemmataceae bacterium]
MRNAFAAEITALAAADQRVVLLSGDIGNRLFDEYKVRAPGRFFNCGVAEANMIGMAAGMAASGLRPVAYTITPFITTRCLEQIRVDVCYHHVPVIIVGTGSGLSYASLGATHHSCEDIAFLRALPHMIVVCPGDPVEVKQALRAALAQDEPVYIRLGKKGEPVVHKQPPDFVIGKGIVVRPGNEVCLISTGNTLAIAGRAAEELAKKGVSAQVVSLHTVKPLDEPLLADGFARFQVMVTIEEHSLIGGLGASIAEWVVDRPPQKARLLRIGTTDCFIHEAGNQEYARNFYGLTAARIAERTLEAMQGRLADGAIEPGKRPTCLTN